MSRLHPPGAHEGLAEVLHVRSSFRLATWELRRVNARPEWYILVQAGYVGDAGYGAQAAGYGASLADAAGYGAASAGYGASAEYGAAGQQGYGGQSGYDHGGYGPQAGYGGAAETAGKVSAAAAGYDGSG